MRSSEEKSGDYRHEIDRSQEDVFAYLDELDRRSGWQGGVISSKRARRPIRAQAGARASAQGSDQAQGDPAKLKEILERRP